MKNEDMTSPLVSPISSSSPPSRRNKDTMQDESHRLASSPDLTRNGSSNSLYGFHERGGLHSLAIDQVSRSNQPYSTDRHQSFSIDILPGSTSERTGSQSNLSSIDSSPRRLTLRPLSGVSGAQSSPEGGSFLFSADALRGRSSVTNSSTPKTPKDLCSGESGDVSPVDRAITPADSDRGMKEKVQDVYLQACRMTGVVPCDVVCNNLAQESISLKHRTLGSTSVRAVCIALVHNIHVTTIDLSSNNIGSGGASCVAQLLQENRNIVSLNLNENNISSRGLRCITKSLRRHKRIQHLMLSGNKLLDDVGQYLAGLMETNENLKELDLSHNEIGDKTLALMSAALGNNESLRVLRLGWNMVKRRGAKCLSAALSSNEYLEELDLSWNGIGPEGCVHLGRMLATNKALRIVDLSNNRVTVAGLGHIVDGISQNKTLQFLKLRDNPVTSTGITWAVAQLMSSKNTALQHIDVGNMPIERPLVTLLRTHERGATLRLNHGAVVRPCSDFISEGLEDTQQDVLVHMFDFMRKRNLRVIDLFNTFGKNGTWHITKQDVKTALAHHMQIEISTEEAADLLKRLDMDRDGKVSLQDLIAAQRYHNRRLAIQAEEMRKKRKDAVVYIRKSMPRW